LRVALNYSTFGVRTADAPTHLDIARATATHPDPREAHRRPTPKDPLQVTIPPADANHPLYLRDIPQSRRFAGNAGRLPSEQHRETYSDRAQSQEGGERE
jgi:hypothetical protein